MTLLSDSNGSSSPSPKNETSNHPSNAKKKNKKKPTLEETLLQSWKVSNLCRKKVKITGKEVQYHFRFNLNMRRSDIGKKCLNIRSNRVSDQEKYEHSLAIPQ